jgi:uncharacterized protein YjgD (DUF1641 family)
MTTSTDRKKVANIYIDAETHEIIKQLAAHQSTSMQTVIASWLDETKPIMAQMVQAFEDIKKGEDTNQVLINLLAKGLRNASDTLTTDYKENDDATDNRQDN